MGKKAMNMLKKHVATVHCENNVSLLQRKLFNALLFNAYDELLEQNRHQITLGELCSLIGYQGHNYDAIKSAIKTLIGTVIEWNLTKDDVEGWSASALLASAHFHNGTCFYSYSSDIKTFLYSPKMYASINMNIQSKFTSNYALALYENCVRYRELYLTRWFDLSLFRKLMGVPQNQYPSFGDFKKRILDKALQEINEYSDIRLKIEFKKKGRAVHSLRFLIEDRRVGQPTSINLPAIDELANQFDENNNEVLKKLTSIYGLTRKAAKDLREKYEDDYIIEKMKLIEDGAPFQSGTINNLSAYIIHALQEDYKAPKSSAEILKQKRAEQDEIEKQKRLEEKRKAGHDAAYNKYRSKFIDKLLSNISLNEKENLEKDFLNYLDRTNDFLIRHMYEEDGLNNPVVNSIFKVFLGNNYSHLIKGLLSKEEFLAVELDT